MAEVVAPPLDLDGNVVTAQVVEFIGGITLGAIQSLGEAMDQCAMDDDEDSVFYDAAEAPQEHKSSPPHPVGPSCEELSQTAGGEAKESRGPCCDADRSPEQREQAACEELPNSLGDTNSPAWPLGQEREEADRPLCDDRKLESSLSGPESVESTQLLVSAETEMLGQPQPQSCEPVSSGNEKSGESLVSISAESTQPEHECEKLQETPGDDDESGCPETEESAESSIMNNIYTQSLVAEGEESSQPESIDTNAESLNKESEEHVQSTCIESGESVKYWCDVEESEPNVKSQNYTSVQSVCTESGETIQALCDHKASEQPLCQANEELVPSSCLESAQSTLSGSISDGEGLEPSQTQEGQSVCEASAQPDNSASLRAAATSSMDVSNQSTTDQQENEDTVAPGVCTTEHPGQPVCEAPAQPDISAGLPEAANSERSEPETDGATAVLVAATSSSPTDQHETETAVPDDSSVCPIERPGEIACEALTQPDSSQSVPEGLCPQPETDSTAADLAATTTPSTDVCSTSPTNPQETEETKETAAPHDTAIPVELPGESVCEVSAQPDNSNSVPEVASCPDSQPKTENAAAAEDTTAISSMDMCNTSPPGQLETEETATADDSACPTELPGEHDNVTTEGELSGSLGEFHSTSTEPQRLISKETQTEILEEATAMSEIQSEQEKTEQEKPTTAEAVQEEQAAGVTGGSDAADTLPTPSAVGEGDRPSAGLECPGDTSSGDDLTADSQDEALDGSGTAEARRSRLSGSGSGSGSPPSRETASLGRRKKTLRHHSFNKSKYNTVSYRKIRRGNTRQRIDEFEAMMNM